MSTKSLDVIGRNKPSISNQFQETDDANVHENENHFDWLNEASPNDQIQNDSQTPPIEEWDRLGLEYEQDLPPVLIKKPSFLKQNQFSLTNKKNRK
jgi:hypothetical protein